MNGQGKKAPRRVLIVDGYNIINARQGGVGGALADARDRLLAELSDYAGYTGQQVILVFDAWMSDRLQRTREQHGNVTVVYTQKGEIADHYIERLCDEYAEDIDLRRVEVRVASSDALEQTIILGRGATRLSARELMYEIQHMRAEGFKQALPAVSRRTPIADRLPEEVRKKLEAMRADLSQAAKANNPKRDGKKGRKT